MPSPGFVAVSPALVDEFSAVAGPENVVLDPAGIESLSKDYYWYSPVLSARLKDRRASVAVKIDSLDVLRAVASVAVKARAPITLRGGATGNYGQCIPLYGGLVIDLSGMSRLIAIKDAVATAEPGVRLATIENAARAQGWELKCYPSTWVKATLGGFLGGGSGGIGGISWGGLGEPGTIRQVKLLTIEEEPQLLTLVDREALSAFHAYGTNGIMIEIQLGLAPAYAWDQLVIGARDWAPLFEFAEEIARDDTVRKRLLTVLEDPIPSFFKPIKKFYPPDHHLIFLEVEASATAAVRTRAEAAGLVVPHVIPAHEPRRAPMLSDYTWNHTTLWAIKADQAWTYLQAGFGPNVREQIQILHAQFPGELLFHLEFTKNTPGPGLAPVVGVGGIPLVKFTTEARLAEIITACRAIGVSIADPHTCYVEEGWASADFSPHLALKHRADPHGLLNPGKMKKNPRDPFSMGHPDPKFLFT